MRAAAAFACLPVALTVGLLSTACGQHASARADAGSDGGHGVFFGFGGAAQCPPDAGRAPVSDGDAGHCTPTAHVSFTADVAPLLARNCAGEACHESTWADPAAAYGALVGVPAAECCDGRRRVQPGRPDRSYILDKLRGQNLCDGERMPLGGDQLPPQDITIVDDWICEGAPK
jgi:hypothetical protein